MDWESLRNIFLQYLEEQLEKWDKDFEKAYKEILKKLKEQGYEITPELQNQLNQFAKEKIEEVNSLLKEVVVVATTGLSLKDPLVDSIVKEVFNYRYPDGLNLSERLWGWSAELIHGLKQALQNALSAGRSADAIKYELQSVIDRYKGEKRAIVLKEKLPKWIEELKHSAKRALKDPKAIKEFEKKLEKAQKYVEKLSKEGSYYSAKHLLKQFEKAVDEGKEYLIDKSIQYHLYQKQLTRLKTIARTEASNAYHKAQIEITIQDEDLVGYKWHLSRSHPKPDICDYLANVNYGLGKGIHPKDKVPRAKAHPNCMCYITPVYSWETKGKPKEKPTTDKKLLERFAPEYVKDLIEVGIDIEQLFDKNLKAFKRKSDLEKRPFFSPLQTIGKVIRKGEWKKVKVKGLKRVLQKKLGYIPEDVLKYIEGKEEIDSLMEHYFKRKYLPDEPIRPKTPKDLESWIKETLKKENSLVFEISQRYIIVGDKFAVIIEHPDKKISVYGLRGGIEQWKKENKWEKELGKISYLKKRLIGD